MFILPNDNVPVVFLNILYEQYITIAAIKTFVITSATSFTPKIHTYSSIHTVS